MIISHMQSKAPSVALERACTGIPQSRCSRASMPARTVSSAVKRSTEMSPAIEENEGVRWGVTS